MKKEASSHTVKWNRLSGVRCNLVARKKSVDLKGLEVARIFFEEWGLPYLRSEFPHLSDRAACLLCGGSQSLGNDDDLSRDHGWGPGFSIILTGEDMRRSGRRLSNAINKAAPRECLGCKFCWPDKSITVHSLNPWFRNFTKFSHPPKTCKAWLRMREDNLYMLRHASVFHDPLGEFTSRKEGFRYYPRDAWLHRISAETFSIWHFGQYNFLTRLTQRRDPIAIFTCLGIFIQSTMKISMLLNEDFTPYWKWLPTEFRKQPNVVELESWLSELAASEKIEDQIRLVDIICQDVYSRLVNKNLISETPTGHPHPLMCAHRELNEQCV